MSRPAARSLFPSVLFILVAAGCGPTEGGDAGSDAGSAPSTDAGGELDAGSSADAGNNTDAGSPPDAGNNADAGNLPDAGDSGDDSGVVDPVCEGIVCDQGGPTCEGEVAVQLEANGACVNDNGLATCEYAELSSVDCGATGEVCVDGGCQAKVERIITGGAFSLTNGCFLREDGTASCWGADGFGQLGPAGTGDLVGPNAAVALPFDDILDIAIGNLHTCVLRSSNLRQLSCFGENAAYQLGNGGASQTRDPALTLDLGGDVVAIAAHWNATTALLDNGSVVLWGTPIGASAAFTAPTEIATGVDTLDTGRRAFLLFDTGTLSYYGELGWGLPTVTTTTPYATNLQFAHVASFWDHSCGALTDGTAVCFGRDEGRAGTGDNSMQERADPIAVSGVSDVVELAATGTGLTCGRRADGSVVCWGLDGSSNPKTATEVGGSETPAFIQIASAWNEIYGLTEDSEVWLFGSSVLNTPQVVPYLAVYRP